MSAEGQSTPRTMLVERSFEVPAAPEQAWSALADVESWPRWAPHIARARVSPPGRYKPAVPALRFRPMGRSRFTMTRFDPPRSWTWTGRVMGVTIDYEHRFEPVELTKTRMVWTVCNRRSRLGLRERLFAAIYGRLIDRAWPSFVSWLSARTER